MTIKQKSLKEYLEHLAQALGGTIEIQAIQKDTYRSYGYNEPTQHFTTARIIAKCYVTDMRQILNISVLEYKDGSLGTDVDCTVIIPESELLDVEAEKIYWDVERSNYEAYKKQLATVDFGERHRQLKQLLELKDKFNASFDIVIKCDITPEVLYGLGVKPSTEDIIDHICDGYYPDADDVLEDFIQMEIKAIENKVKRNITQVENTLWDGKLIIDYRRK